MCGYVFYFRLLFFLLLVNLAEASAEKEFNDINSIISDVNHNWADLSQDDYVSNLVVCQLKIQAHKWQKNIWPAENKEPKPPFSEVVDVQATFQFVNALLKKQAVLASYFKITINDSMLQNDINRMASNTKDSESLTALFTVLDNHPRTIAECIARPTVVEQKFENAFSMNKVIHQSTKQQAEAELLLYRQDKSAYLTTGKEQHITYVLQQADSKEDKSHFEQHDYSGYVNKLDYNQFQSTKNKLSREKLQETDRAFYFSDTITQSDQHIEVKTWLWEKQTSYEWLDQQRTVSIKHLESIGDFHLPVVSQNKWQSGEKSHNTGNWWAPQTTPYGMSGHTAVWTGSHMIVWSGYLNGGWNYDPTTDQWTTVNSLDGPSNRTGHTAIWTGTHMIIWGGIQSNNHLQNGGRYDPMTNSWTPVNAIGAPDARIDHTAIWTGTQMIVWGGSNNTGLLNSGGVYDPETETWVLTSTVNAPDARVLHTAVWADSVMIVWGGVSGFYFNTGGVYDPVNDQWSLMSTVDAPSSRILHSAVWTGNEMIVWGGNGGSYYELFDYLSTGAIYYPDTDTWVATNSVNALGGRAEHTAIWTGDSMIIWGGFIYFTDEFSQGEVALDTGKKFDPTSNTWTDIIYAGSPDERYKHTAVWTGNEMIVWGGENPYSGFYNSGGKYNPVANVWNATGPNNLPSSRIGHIGVWTGNEMVIWGGSEGEFLVRTGGKYEPSTDTWIATNLNNSPDQRIDSTAVWTGSEVIVWGGFNGGGFASSGKRYNPVNNSWGNMTNTNTPTGRTAHVAVWSGSEMIVWGGDQFGNTRFNSGGVYDPNLNTWTATNTLDAPPASAELAAVWTGNEMIVWGGVGDGGSQVNTGGVYDLAQDTWALTSTVGAPSARANHTAVWADDRMIVWGGAGSGVGLGYLYDSISNTWSVTSSDNAPLKKTFHSAVWTGIKMVVWGGNGTGSNRAGGIYDPVVDVWVPTSLVQAPSGRSNHTSVWTGNEMIIWGGYSNVMGVFTPHGSYHISGVLNGLNGDQVVLQNNGGDDLVMTENGLFTFSQSVGEGMGYNISVLSSPQSPAQTCSILNGSEAHVVNDINDIEVNCVNDFFDLGVVVTGLASGTELGLLNNGGDPLTVDTDSQLTYFPTQVGNGQSYLITIDSQPTGPNQTCTIAPGEESGTIIDADALANIDCVTNEYLLGVDVSGLQPGDTVSFVNDFNQYLPIQSDGMYSFTDPYVDGTPYQVTLILQPTDPGRTCSFVDPNNGIFSGMDQYVGVVCAASDLIFGDGFE